VSVGSYSTREPESRFVVAVGGLTGSGVLPRGADEAISELHTSMVSCSRSLAELIRSLAAGAS
jgi:hypothetical protein